MDKSQNHYIERKKSGTEEYIAFGFIYKQLKNQAKVICGDRIESSSCLRVREEVGWERAQRNLWGEENIRYLV